LFAGRFFWFIDPNPQDHQNPKMSMMPPFRN
jgi:hypothetical protein